MNYDARVSSHIISSQGATVNVNASVWHPFLFGIKNTTEHIMMQRLEGDGAGNQITGGEKRQETER